MAQKIVTEPPGALGPKLTLSATQIALAQRLLRLRISRVADMNVIRLHNCKRCGKTWFPRSPGVPKICPTCKTTYWNTPKKEKNL